MNSLKIGWLVSLVFQISVLAVIGLAQDPDAARTKAFWEKAIAAKGGRSALHAVRAIHVSTVSNNPQDSTDFRSTRLEDLYVLPNKWWSWRDQRPGFQLSVNQFDFEKEVLYEVTGDSHPLIIRPLKVPDTSGGRSLEAKRDVQYKSQKEWFIERQLLYLMETKWLQPTLTGSRVESVGKAKVEVVQVSFGREKIDYYLDTSTHLPFRIVMMTWIEATKSNYVDAHFLEDYVEVGGIKLPRIVRRGERTKTTTNYLVNPSFDTTLFDRAPTIAAGPDAWRIKP